MTSKIMPPTYFDNKFILTCDWALINEKTLKGICKMENEATRILVKLKANALFISPLESAQKALVIPQTGHSTPNNLSIRQK